MTGGLKRCLDLDWSKKSTKLVFLILDAPCHGKKYHNLSDEYPKGCPEGLKLEDLMQEFRKMEIELNIIKIKQNCNKMIKIMQQFHTQLTVSDFTGSKADTEQEREVRRKDYTINGVRKCKRAVRNRLNRT